MDENGNNTKNILIAVLLCCVMVLQVVQIVQNIHISEELALQNSRIEGVKDYVDSGLLSLGNDVYASAEEFKKSLQQQDSLIEEVRFRRGSLKEDNRTGEVFFYVVLNKVKPDTQVKIQIDSDKYVSMERKEGSTFEGVYEADIFNDPGHDHAKYGNCTVKVHITNGDETVVEKIEEPYLMLTNGLFKRFLPDFCSINGYYGIIPNGKKCKTVVKTDGNIDERIKNITFFIECNGVIIKEIKEINNCNPIEINTEIGINENDVIEMYFLGEDDLGYTYRKTVFVKKKIVKTESSTGFPYDDKDGIYDKDGNKLY